MLQAPISGIFLSRQLNEVVLRTLKLEYVSLRVQLLPSFLTTSSAVFDLLSCDIVYGGAIERERVHFEIFQHIPIIHLASPIHLD